MYETEVLSAILFSGGFLLIMWAMSILRNPPDYGRDSRATIRRQNEDEGEIYRRITRRK